MRTKVVICFFAVFVLIASGCRFMEVFGGGLETAGDVIGALPHPAASFIGLAVSGAGLVIRTMAKRWHESERASLVAKVGTAIIGAGGLTFAGENADLIASMAASAPPGLVAPAEPGPVTATAQPR